MNDIVLMDVSHCLTDLSNYLCGLVLVFFGLFDHLVKILVSRELTNKIDVFLIVKASVKLGDIGVIEEHV